MLRKKENRLNIKSEEEKMVKLNDVKKLNEMICIKYGDMFGVRSTAILEEALNKVTIEEAAKWIAMHHPFFDGNKRTAILMLVLDKGWFGFDPDLVMANVQLKGIFDVLSVT